MDEPLTHEGFLARTWPVAALVLVYVLMVFLVSPAGEFPTNDDWAYARVTKIFLETGQIRLGGWVNASLVFQALWGTLFCLPFGFSFAALRLSTLVMSLVGVLVFYGLLRQYGFNRSVSFVGTLVLAANPLYLSLSYTYMTDVPALAMSLLAALLYLRDSATIVSCGSSWDRSLRSRRSSSARRRS